MEFILTRDQFVQFISPCSLVNVVKYNYKTYPKARYLHFTYTNMCNNTFKRIKNFLIHWLVNG